MECSVKYVREEDSFGAVVSSLRPALCFRGRKVVHAVVSGEIRVRVIEISLHQFDKADSLQYRGHDYPIGRMIKTLQTAAQRKGITQRAAALLERPEVVEEETLPPDEPVAASEPSLERPEKLATAAIGAPRIADRPATAIPEHRAAEARRKAAKKAEARPSIAGAKLTLVAQLAAELGMQPQPLRVLLRAAGLRAPYLDLDTMRKAIKR